ncbi:MAG: hypothetical protein WCG05_00730 [Alphaproteobacteria bacterium]
MKKIIIGLFGVLGLFSFESKGVVQEYLDQMLQVTAAYSSANQDADQFNTEIDMLSVEEDVKEINALHQRFIMGVVDKHRSVAQKKVELKAVFGLNRALFMQDAEAISTMRQKIGILQSCYLEHGADITFYSCQSSMLEGNLGGLFNKLSGELPFHKTSYLPEHVKTYPEPVQAQIFCNLNAYEYEVSILKEIYSIMKTYDAPSATQTLNNIFQNIYGKFFTKPEYESLRLYFGALEGYLLGIIDEIPNPELCFVQKKIKGLSPQEAKQKSLQAEIKVLEETIKELKEKKYSARKPETPPKTRAALMKEKELLQEQLDCLNDPSKDLEILRKYQADAERAIGTTKTFLESGILPELVKVEAASAVKKTKKKKKKKTKNTHGTEEREYSDDEEVPIFQTGELKEVGVPNIVEEAQPADELQIVQEKTDSPETVSLEGETDFSEEVAQGLEEAARQYALGRTKKEKGKKPEEEVVIPTEAVADIGTKVLHAQRMKNIERFWNPTTRRIAWNDFLSFIKEVPGFARYDGLGGSIVGFLFQKDAALIKINVHKAHYPYDSLGIETISRVKRLLAEKLGILGPTA